MDNIVILFLGGLAGLLFSFLESFPRIKRISQIHKTTSFSFDANPAENIGEVAGEVVSEGYHIHSPLSQTECVFWHAEVMELRSSGEDSYWEIILDETSVHPFDVLDIENGTGIYKVYPNGAELLLHTDLFKESAIHVTLEPNIMKAVEKLQIAPIGPNGLTKPLQIREQVIKADETVYIFGRIKEKSGTRVISSSQDGSPFLISDRSQRAVLASLYWRVIASVFIFTILGVLFAQLIANGK